MDTYEKKYKEALERAKELIAKWTGKNKDFYVEDYAYIFPELAESEDERIRKWILEKVQGYADSGIPCPDDIQMANKALAYLEKQKETLHISETCKENSDSFTDEQKVPDCCLKCNEYEIGYKAGYEHGCTAGYNKAMKEVDEHPKEQKSAEWGPQPESLEALMYAIEGKWEMIKPTSYLSRRLEDLYEGLVNTYNVDETLLAKLPKTTYTAEDIEELRALKDKIDASIDEKPEEWSEEDRLHYANVLEALEYVKGCKSDYDKIEAVKSDIVWFKSLRPQSKPEWSEEDEEMLNLTKTQLRILQSYLSHTHSESMPDMEYSSQLLQIEKCVSWLDIHFKSLRSQPIRLKEAYKEGFQTARHATALAFMNYLDENRPEGKMCLSNGECEEIEKAFLVGDWEKIERYFHKYSWKPSEINPEEVRLLDTTISFLKDFADKGYENAVECIDWLKSKRNGTARK